MIVRKGSACCSIAVLGTILGCGQTGLPGPDGNGGSPSGKIDLPQIVGRYVIAAGQEKQSKAILPPVSLRGASSGSLTLRLMPSDITFTSENGEGGTMLFAVSFGVVSNYAEACAEPVVAYSPFTISVNGDTQVTDVSGSFEVDSDTVDLLRSGSYTICTTYSSTVAGTIIVESLTLN